MSNDSKTDANDKSAEKQTSRSEQNVEAKQRADVNSSVTNYTDHVKSQREEPKISGRSKATGAGADAHGKGGLASAKDLLGDLAHETLAKKSDTTPERKAQLMAEIERDGYIVGKPQSIAQVPSDNETQKEKADRAWLERREQRRENHHNDIAEQLKDSLYKPRDGQTWKLADFLNRAHSPISEAYELSKHLKEGQPGKSNTLEEVIQRLQSCPWADQINIRIDGSGKFSDYSNEENTINLNPKHTSGKQIEEFVHESFHATHQFLDKLYGHGKLEKQDYVNTFVWGEVNSMLTEARVHNDLKLPGHVDFKYKDELGEDQTLHIDEFMRSHSPKDLFDFLYHAEPAKKGEKVYSQHYAETYNTYREKFNQNQPVAEAFIKQWVQKGKPASDI